MHNERENCHKTSETIPFRLNWATIFFLLPALENYLPGNPTENRRAFSILLFRFIHVQQVNAYIWNNTRKDGGFFPMESNNMPQRPQPKRPQKPPEPPAPLYACPDPYPPIEVDCVNPHYAQILKISFASSKSETTAVMQYAYQSWVLHTEFSEIANVMHHVAMVEMHHLEILGRLIDLLGGTPSYSCIQRNRQFPWNATMVFYGRMVRQMMQNNIAAEQDAIRQYQKQIQMIQDCHIQEILKRIIQDEELHIELFKKYL